MSAWWVNGKVRILMFIAMNITAFAALDSFTTAVMWQEVAWTVFAGMGWLVTQHLRNFQLHYPRGWTYMLRYPMKVALNIAIIFLIGHPCRGEYAGRASNLNRPVYRLAKVER
ncbi:hypothetical protein ACFTAO_09130 [Paenibacillus rhizoplanae]